MKIKGKFNFLCGAENEKSEVSVYENAHGVIDEKIDCGTEIQGYISIYSDEKMNKAVFRFPILILKPSEEGKAEEALLIAAIDAACQDMKLSK
ncbi:MULTISPECIES: hypothetical protein [Brenneria]|uniref:Uncharacterized protein n=1 Tax=Brenneria nigrifluens DSM 30175 = ATCC 13028 TaxID=1121120 RepID=A0A2U1UQE9_9GAMM|nr:MULTISPECIES: hypothetical protein [Brenneria]EHD23647.1 hypothetical protein BrE312_4329 [Brenneria sp. EniD312]PWC23903.1 hypothetical protein DDT54_12275 [Brenneria nigrifluens DSM 30175 = ATCC 13028]QCR06574.1 hypothetical protein EH206_21920 [Brenneria nigrifluens DSM 30175 = ATCC 13028]